MALRTHKYISVVVPLVVAMVMVFVVRSGVITPLFLIPLGILFYRANVIQTRIAAVSMIGINVIVAFIVTQSTPELQLFYGLDVLYVGILVLSFLFVVLDVSRNRCLHKIRGTWRIFIAALLGSAGLLPLFVLSLRDGSLSFLVQQQAELLAVLMKEQAGSDVVQQSLAEQTIQPEDLLRVIQYIGLRGGLVLAHVILFGGSAYVSRMFAPGAQENRWMIRRYHAGSVAVWILSFSLLAIIVGSLFSLEVLDIVGWNGTIAMLLVFFLQGLGVVIHTIEHPLLSRGSRFLLRTILLVLILSPGINAIVLAGCILIGIAENWVSLRKPYTTGPSSTPGM
ncbi:MAG: hypothetical protein SNJ56_02675 [Termitinemataceae bacterium]